MNIYPYFLQKVIFPFSNILLKRNFWTYYNDLMKSQYEPIHIINKRRLKKLKKLIKHAYETVPLYKELMDKKGIKPNDIKIISDISKLPIVTKKDLKKGFPEHCTSNSIPKSKWMKDSTSGSTGSPFQFIRDEEFSDQTLANTMRNYTWTGIDIGDKIVSLWGFHKTPFAVKMYETLIRRKLLSSFDVEKDYLKYYFQLKKYKPKLIEAYSASITQFAKLLKKHNKNDLKIPAVISSAETLYPENRELINTTLNTKVYNRYGSREVGNVAHECEKHTGLHINAESYIVEIVNKDKNGKGKLIVTNLTNFTMPFIRYDTQDYATETNETCDCGRTLPLLKSIDGRVTDYIRLQNGKELSFLFFNYFFEQYGAFLNGFQIIQTTKKNIEINLITSPAYNKKKEEEIIKGIQQKIGNMNITIKKVTSIKPEKSGKIRPIKRTI